MPRPAPLARTCAWAGLALLAGGCGSGGGAPGPEPVPAPALVQAAGPVVDAAAPGWLLIDGQGFTGAPGSAVTIRLRADDGLLLAACGADTLVFPGEVVSATRVQGRPPAFLLLRDVAAWVELDLPDGVRAASTAPVAALHGVADETLDHDGDGVPDPCDPKTYTFEGETVGARPAEVTALDGPGQPGLAVVDRAGDRAVAFTGAGSPIAYERLDRARADVPLQDTTVLADLDPSGGSLNLELGNEGSLAGAAGASLIVQVQASGAIVFYQRMWNQILTSTPGPSLPGSGRIRLRLRRGPDVGGALHLDGHVGGAWQDDLAVYAVADLRPYRGLDVALSNYFGGARALRRLTVVREPRVTPAWLAASPAVSADWQVFQRGADGTAAIPLRLVTSLHGGGSADVAVAASASGAALPGFDFGTHVFALPGAPRARTDLRLLGVPAGGNYDVQVRVRDRAGALVAQQALLDVAVGDVWLAAGQSNTSGYSGVLTGADAPGPLAHLYGNDGVWKQAREPMDDGTDQTDAVSREFPACSSMLAFALSLSAATGVPVGVVPAPLGGTNLYAQWQRNAAFPAHRGTLYGSLLARARSACPEAPPRGLLWFQGESDALAGRTTAQHEADLAGFVASLRADLAAPGLAFLCGQLGTYSAAPYPAWVGLQEAQRRVVAADAQAALATAVDLPRADAIHFSVAGYRTLGRRFALGARQRVHGHAVDATNDLVAQAVGAGGATVVLTYERPVTGGSAALYRVTDGAGAATVQGVAVSGATVTLTLDRPLGADGRCSYGWSTAPAVPWVLDAADGIPVPCFDGLVLAP